MTPLWASTRDFDKNGHAVGRAATAGPDGSVDVRLALSPTERASAHTNNDWLNISVVTIDSNGDPQAFSTFSRYLGSDPDQLAEQSWIDASPPVILTTTSDTGGSSPNVAIAPLVSCSYYWEPYSTQDRYAQYAELHVDKDVLQGQVTYGSTADSTVDVVSHASGGPWSVTGSLHVANGQASATGTNAGGLTNYHWALRTLFRYVNSRLYKDCVGGPYHAYTGSEEIDTESWLGGGSTQSNTVVQPPWTNVRSYTYRQGGEFHRNSYQLVKWSAGAGAYGLTFGIQSGASQYVKYDYRFGTAKSVHYLYGDTDYPAYAKRIFQYTP